jgi:hypothetical protein
MRLARVAHSTRCAAHCCRTPVGDKGCKIDVLDQRLNANTIVPLTRQQNKAGQIAHSIPVSREDEATRAFSKSMAWQLLQMLTHDRFEMPTATLLPANYSAQCIP